MALNYFKFIQLKLKLRRPLPSSKFSCWVPIIIDWLVLFTLLHRSNVRTRWIIINQRGSCLESRVWVVCGKFIYVCYHHTPILLSRRETRGRPKIYSFLVSFDLSCDELLIKALNLSSVELLLFRLSGDAWIERWIEQITFSHAAEPSPFHSTSTQIKRLKIS